MSSIIRDFKGKHAFLSNFYRVEIEYSGYFFKTSEHMFNALKTSDRLEAEFVMDAATPGEAKKRGRQVTLKPDWDQVGRFDAMRLTLGYKFTAGHYLARDLVHTGDAILIEGNTWHDNVWGDCTCGRFSCQPEGQNHLGKMLMELRTDLRKWIH